MELGEIWGYVTDRLYTVDDFDADGKLKAGIPKVEGYNPNPGDILYKIWMTTILSTGHKYNERSGRP